MDITYLQKELELKRNKKGGISTKTQYDAGEVWEMVGRGINIKVLLGLSKRKPSVFMKAKEKLYADIKDGIIIRNKPAYFMWLIKYFNGTSK